MIELLFAEYERNGDPWPISGDGIARTRANHGLGGFVGVVDWAALEAEQ